MQPNQRGYFQELLNQAPLGNDVITRTNGGAYLQTGPDLLVSESADFCEFTSSNISAN